MLTTLLPLLAALFLAAGLVILAPRKPGYSHLKHSISELGEVGAPQQRLVGFGLFLPVGLILLPVAYLLQKASPPAAALALCIAAGYLVAAVFPCDPGSPLWGSMRQLVHNVGGGVEYVGGGAALMILAEKLGTPFREMGGLVLAATVALSVLPSTSVRGLVQRVAEACLFGGLALASWQVR